MRNTKNNWKADRFQTNNVPKYIKWKWAKDFNQKEETVRLDAF